MKTMLTSKGLIAFAATGLFIPLAVLSSTVAIVILSTTPSIAQHGTEGRDTRAMKSENKAHERVHRAIGTVTRVVPNLGTVMIAHLPVPSLDWPAMNMTFGMRDEALLDELDRGDVISFEFVRTGDSYTVIRIEWMMK